MNKVTINLDFDGTCTAHDFPRIGADIGAVPVLKELVAHGHKLILFTMRSNKPGVQTSDDPAIYTGEGRFLDYAIAWFQQHDIPLYGIQTNPTQHNWTESPKSYAEFMIDDSAVGCPLRWDPAVSERPFVDWVQMRKHLVLRGLLPMVPYKLPGQPLEKVATTDLPTALQQP